MVRAGKGDKDRVVGYGAVAYLRGEAPAAAAGPGKPLSEEAGKAFGRLLAAASAGDSYLEAIAAQEDADRSIDRAKQLSDNIGELAAKLTEEGQADTPEKARRILLEAAQATAGALGAPITFDSSDLDGAMGAVQQMYEALLGAGIK